MAGLVNTLLSPALSHKLTPQPKLVTIQCQKSHATTKLMRLVAKLMRSVAKLMIPVYGVGFKKT